MTQYYYLVSSLPELLPESLPRQLDALALKQEIIEQLSDKDKQWLAQLYWTYDNANLLKLATDYISVKDKRDFFESSTPEDTVTIGNYSLQELRQGFKELEGLPSYMLAFIEQIVQLDKPFVNGLNALENDLLQGFYTQVQQSKNSFIQNYFTFDATLRNLLLAHTTRKLQKQEVHTYFVGDSELVQLLQKNTTADFGTKGLVEFADALFQILDIENWIEREQKLDLLRWNFIDQLNQFEYFSIDVVLAFLLKIQWVDRWMQWDPLKGQIMLDKLSKQVDESFNLELLTQ